MNQETDYMTPVSNFVRHFFVNIPSREDWTEGSIIRDKEDLVEDLSTDLGGTIFERHPIDCSVLKVVDRAEPVWF